MFRFRETTMRTKLLWLSPLALVVVLVPIGACREKPRSVRPLVNASLLTPSQFDPAQSAGFFCGIRRFSNKELTEVQFAADDAVDLAYTFALEKTDLLRPSRVTIALSGNPSKSNSKERLRRLKAAGARIVMDASGEKLRQLLHEQATLAGRGGVFITSFATHGFNSDGIPYLLAPDSKFLDVETSLSVPDIAEIAGRSTARSLILLDACRERVSSVTRAGLVERRAAATLMDKMTRVEGQVIFSAAAPGGYAYDDPKRGNGVFTAEIIESLRCAGTDRGMVTVEQLAKDVEREVLRFLKKRNPSLKKATQLSTEGSTVSMPLARCRPGAEPFVPIARVDVRDATIRAVDAKGQPRWEKTLGGAIRHTYVGPLFREKTNYLVVLSDERNDASLVTIYDSAGNVFASYDHDGPLRHMEVQRESKKHNPRVILAGTRRHLPATLAIADSAPTVLLLGPEPRGGLREEWYGAIRNARDPITRLRVGDAGKNREISVITSAGNTIRVDFDGNLKKIDGPRSSSVQFSRIRP